jgi:hypothetical protein
LEQVFADLTLVRAAGFGLFQQPGGDIMFGAVQRPVPSAVPALPDTARPCPELVLSLSKERG